MKISITKVIFLALTLILIPTATEAQTPDMSTPAEEDYCDRYSDSGRKFGICNAWYEAMDCDDSAHKASACENLKAMLDGLGVDTSPSSGTATPCPCFGDLSDEGFTQDADCSDLANGVVEEEEIDSNGNRTKLKVQAINDPFYACIGVNGEPKFDISSDEATTCVNIMTSFCEMP
jgi:hypothetical protein